MDQLEVKSQVVNNLVVSKQCGLSPDKESSDKKTFTIELTIDNVTVEDMARGLLKNEVIRWQNANRPKFDKLVNRSVHKLRFARPMADVDPEDAMVAKLQGMASEEERTAYLTEMLRKATK